MAIFTDFVGVRKNNGIAPEAGTISQGAPGGAYITGSYIITCNAGDIIDLVPTDHNIQIASDGVGVNTVYCTIKKVG